MPYENDQSIEQLPENRVQSAPPKRQWFQLGKVGPAFWTVSSIVSMVVNIILIVVLLSLGRQLFALKHLVEDQLLGGLYENFVAMDNAHIRTSIPVAAQVPAKFDLPLSTNTTVTLTEDTYLNNATIYEFNAGALYISRAATNIILPAGTQLPVALNLTVPVDQQIPVNLIVDVDIPLNQTDLHKPFVGLQEVVKPYYTLLDSLPDTWPEALCGPEPSGLCKQFVH